MNTILWDDPMSGTICSQLSLSGSSCLHSHPQMDYHVWQRLILRVASHWFSRDWAQAQPTVASAHQQPCSTAAYCIEGVPITKAPELEKIADGHQKENIHIP